MISNSLMSIINSMKRLTELLPEEFRSFETAQFTIPAGEVSAPVINLTIKPFTTPNNEAYAIPVRITSVAGPIGLVGNANHILYLLTSPNKQKAVVLKSANKTSLNFKNEIPVTQWTIEYWIKFDNTTGRPTGDWVGPANIAFRRLIFADKFGSYFFQWRFIALLGGWSKKDCAMFAVSVGWKLF